MKWIFNCNSISCSSFVSWLSKLISIIATFRNDYICINRNLSTTFAYSCFSFEQKIVYNFKLVHTLYKLKCWIENFFTWTVWCPYSYLDKRIAQKSFNSREERRRKRRSKFFLGIKFRLPGKQWSLRSLSSFLFIYFDNPI